jgi:hypothetical protein
MNDFIGSEFGPRIARAAANLVALARLWEDGGPFSPAGLKTSVQYRAPDYRVGVLKASYAAGEDRLAAPVRVTSSSLEAEQHLTEGWVNELATLKGAEFQGALATIFVTGAADFPF